MYIRLESKILSANRFDMHRKNPEGLFTKHANNRTYVP